MNRIKIDAPKAWADTQGCVSYATGSHHSVKDGWVRLIRERDWRKLMKLVGACERVVITEYGADLDAVETALDALRAAISPEPGGGGK